MAKMHLLDRDELIQGEKAFVQLHLEKPACLMTNDKFVIRNSSNTLSLGGGEVLDTQPLHHRKRTPKLLDSLRNLADAVLYSQQLYKLINHEVYKKAQPVFVDDLAESLGKSSALIITEIQQYNTGSVLLFDTEGKAFVIHRDLHQKQMQQIIEILQQHHQKNFLLEEGLELKDFTGKINVRDKELAKFYLEALAGWMLKEDVLKQVGNSLSLSNHKVTLDTKTREQLNWLENEIKKVGRHTPLLLEIEKLALTKNISKDQLKMRLHFLVKTGKIHFTEGEYIHDEHVKEVMPILLTELVSRGQGINEKDFRLLIDSSKNFVKAVARIYQLLGYVIQDKFYIHITEEGKKQLK